MHKVIRKKEQFIFFVHWAAIVLWIASLTGCTSAKKLVYFQGTTSSEDTITMPEQFIPTIKKGDILSIQVSSLNAEASAYFNPAAVADGGSTINSSNPLTRTPGYLVDADGTIKLPLVGQLAVVDLTNTKAAELIRNKLTVYLKEPTVNVRNQNFRISVLGEVTRPSLFTIPNEQITLPEALGLAGDLTIYGRRDNVLIIREEGKKRVFARLDLTRRDAFHSPYYSLHPNDVVYVEPGKVRVTSVDRVYVLAPVVIGVLSLIAIIATRR
ncbi:polysaccharide biosynthesis/export family protein [Spirosoma validum]|uniref:Polysaccharide biosynthesis/export family protein n=1 Tax=Spirosoma validum TaxID=2771355 RepID=A0A927AYV2_9BACT|nr:polysaccharide biosynthesis/export family protein [Spirosoma validum]MBD2752281.1 polysaccharide biosynthesis/export family protein [Spirosoma validum]